MTRRINNRDGEETRGKEATLSDNFNSPAEKKICTKTVAEGRTGGNRFKGHRRHPGYQLN